MAKTLEIQFYQVEDVMAMLGVGQTKAYQIIRELNKELKAMGKITISGKVNKKYFDEKILV